MEIPEISGYEILAPLPQGGMSAVFKARQVSLDRVVVLKILPPSMAADGVDIAKFLEEAKITAQLKHQNIVQVYDFGQTPGGIYYFVMEFISGYSVADWIRRKTRLTLEDTLLCAHSVADALSYAWANFGIVHCDIKPDNVIIDGDGTVKVADLGLARSVNSVMDKSKFGMGVVVGTPYYISPEQSQGQVELDCRTDIYSLGAMLYHCVTGKMPFEGLPLLEIMDCQITDQIPDVIDLHPDVSMPLACLIERMMAKNPAHRHRDWQEVVRDMIRVRRNMLPETILTGDAVSTMKRSPARERYLMAQNESFSFAPAITLAEAAREEFGPAPAISSIREEPSGTKARFAIWLQRRLKTEWLLALVMILAVALPSLLVIRVMIISRRAAPVPSGGQSIDESALSQVSSNALIQADTGVSPTPAAEPPSIKQELEAARQWQRANSNQFDEAIQRFAKIAAEASDSGDVQFCRNEIMRIRQVKKAAIAAALKSLRDKAQSLLLQQKWGEAAGLYEQYNGPFMIETLDERTAQAREWRARETDRQAQTLQAAEARKRSERQQWQQVLDEVAARLVAGDAGAALAAAHQAATNAMIAAHRTDLAALTGVLRESGNVNQRLLDSFRLQKDQDVVINLATGPELLTIRDARDDMILAEKKIVVSAGLLGQSKVIRIKDLSWEEKKTRLGTNMTPETAVMHGLAALRDGNLAAAESSWQQAGPLLAEPLIKKLREYSNRQAEIKARRDLIMLLRAAQIYEAVPASGSEESLPGCEACLAAIYRKTYSPQMASLLARNAVLYSEQHGRTEFVKVYAPLLEALKKVTASNAETNTTAADARPETSFPTKTEDVSEISRELFALNPGLTEFNVACIPDDNGRITSVELISLDLKDISPLAKLTDLRAVTCAVLRPGDWRMSEQKAPLTDLAPLQGLRLSELYINHTRVKDLAPLSGMQLTKLDLTGTRVTDLSLLKGMPLRELKLNHLPVKNLQVLTGMPLEYLNIAHTEVSDLTPLTGMKLRRLVANDTRIRDISVLAGMPIRDLNIANTEVFDISPLKAMELYSLNLGRTRVRDFSILSAMPLKALYLNHSAIRDLSPLRNLKLQSLNVRSTRIKDLDPLRNMPLESLDISGTAVRDLEPVQNLPIEEIWLDYDIHQKTRVDVNRDFKDVLLHMPRLQKVNGDFNFR